MNRFTHVMYVTYTLLLYILEILPTWAIPYGKIFSNIINITINNESLAVGY